MGKVVTSESECQSCHEKIEALSLAELAQACFDHVATHKDRTPLSLFPYFTSYYKKSNGVPIAFYLWGEQRHPVPSQGNATDTVFTDTKRTDSSHAHP